MVELIIEGIEIKEAAVHEDGLKTLQVALSVNLVSSGDASLFLKPDGKVDYDIFNVVSGKIIPASCK